MWFEAPEERLYFARLRQAELRAESAAVRRTHHAVRPPVSIERVRGLHIRVGRILIVVGSTLREEDLRPDPIHP